MQSTGRGGAGNMGKSDGIEYTDGGVVREGPYGESGIPGAEYSSGRGGAGNVHPDGAQSATGQARRDDVVVPETNLRETHQADFHTGRGGQGNIHKDKYGGHSSQAEQDSGATGKKGLGEKVKDALRMNGPKN